MRSEEEREGAYQLTKERIHRHSVPCGTFYRHVAPLWRTVSDAVKKKKKKKEHSSSGRNNSMDLT
jgi:hypothetical protein